MDNSKPIFNLNPSNTQIEILGMYQCFQSEQTEEGINGMPEILSHGKIYFCNKCIRNYASLKQLNKHNLKNSCKRTEEYPQLSFENRGFFQE